MSDAELVALSRLLSKVLRHEPDLIGVRLDAQGWVPVTQLVEAIRRYACTPNAAKRLRAVPDVTLEAIHAVVASNSKQRFALSPDGERIRAVQGHSVQVDLGYTPKAPPSNLFHGTAAANWTSIAKEGLHRAERHAVHLSADAVTARAVGSRHGRPIVLAVAAAQMHEDGFQFTEADNGTWLVDRVPARYVRKLD